ncbi:MAG TPA: hypothetical protein ENN90_14500 [Mariniphaga anaerophila]|uniref:Uncharacterized protein n=1 Tax=Mariniphaga anaerophila TaxID=1484053 RepID=A0A831PLQ4_9BACT|nr:hypothetical protein [Mariniphaga anaerophila]
MKKKRIHSFILFFAFILFVAGSCEKLEDLQLPPVTQTGAGTFGCLVNGEIWLPKSIISFPSIPKVSAELVREDEHRIWKFGASQGNSSSFYFGIYKDSLKNGTINIPINELNDIGLYFFSKDFEKPSFSWRQELPGELIITKLDTINMILSGTFWFDAVNDIDEKVEIRDGRFDLIIDQIQP